MASDGQRAFSRLQCAVREAIRWNAARRPTSAYGIRFSMGCLLPVKRDRVGQQATAMALLLVMPPARATRLWLVQRAWSRSRFSKVISSEHALPSSSTFGTLRQHGAVVASRPLDAQALHEQGGECRLLQLCGHARFHNCTPEGEDKTRCRPVLPFGMCC